MTGSDKRAFPAIHYHSTCPTGRVFHDSVELEQAGPGWVDSPARLARVTASTVAVPNDAAVASLQSTVELLKAENIELAAKLEMAIADVVRLTTENEDLKAAESASDFDSAEPYGNPAVDGLPPKPRRGRPPKVRD